MESSPTLKIDAAATWQPVSRSVTSTFDYSTDLYYCKWKARLVDVLIFNAPYGNSSVLFINIVRQFGAVCRISTGLSIAFLMPSSTPELNIDFTCQHQCVFLRPDQY